MAGPLPAYFSSEASGETAVYCHLRKRLKGALVVSMLCFLVSIFSGTAAADPTSPPLSGTYLQLLQRHTAWDEADWRHLFGDFKTLRISKLVIQWSVSSDLAFYPSKTFHSEGKLPLSSILDLADETGIEVHIGLWHDPNFWNNIKAAPELLESYLRHSRYRSKTIAKEIALMAQAHTSFQGWYISEEIDDLNWNEPIRRKILLDHLAGLTKDLREITPGAEVGISSFSNTRLDPESFFAFWKTILAESSIDTLYFQDGIGARKLEMNYLSLYLDAVNRAAHDSGCTLSIVVELFEQKMESGNTEESFQAIPAPISRIEQQMEMAARYTENRIMAFSIPDYMSSSAVDTAQHLYRDYVRKYIEPIQPGSAD